jgi:hypothetical protein
MSVFMISMYNLKFNTNNFEDMKKSLNSRILQVFVIGNT